MKNLMQTSLEDVVDSILQDENKKEFSSSKMELQNKINTDNIRCNTFNKENKEERIKQTFDALPEHMQEVIGKYPEFFKTFLKDGAYSPPILPKGWIRPLKKALQVMKNHGIPLDIVRFTVDRNILEPCYHTDTLREVSLADNMMQRLLACTAQICPFCGAKLTKSDQYLCAKCDGQ